MQVSVNVSLQDVLKFQQEFTLRREGLRNLQAAAQEEISVQKNFIHAWEVAADIMGIPLAGSSILEQRRR